MDRLADDIVFCSVAFGDAYVQQQSRLRESIKRQYKEPNLIFHTNTLPPGSKPFLDSLYGFKPHLAQEALDKGFKRVILLDPAMILVGKIDRFLSYPVIAVKDTSVLWNVTSLKAAEYYSTTRGGIKEKGWHLVGGSFYFFDFHNPETKTIFDQWYWAEKLGLFGSQKEAASEQLQGHRYDETMMALAMYSNNIEPQDPDEVGYCTGENTVWEKRHFK